MKRILIVGASSAIAEATARLYAKRRNSLYLVGRRADVLESIAADLRIRGAVQVACEAMDINDLAAHEGMLTNAESTLQGIDVVLVAHGTLGDQQASQRSVHVTVRELATNGVSTVALLTHIGQMFEQRRRGTIAVISSVAGDRGRQSNYVYGSAKALVSAFLSGLRQRLSRVGVTVITVKPGFVDTPMTAHMKKGALWATPDAVARAIVRAIDRSRPVIYVPGFWRPLMFVVRAIPEGIFQSLRL